MANKTFYLSKFSGLFLLFMLLSLATLGQNIMLDKLVKAGELTLFPDMSEPNVYYYIPDKPRLAVDVSGKPQFSFLRYVENVSSAPGADEIDEGTGGGILHAVVELSVTPQQLQEARNELSQINANGKIAGPVMYSGGTIAIISSFANTEGDLSKQVVGIGKAPLIDGQKAAISMELTKKGAKILWESLKSNTPDLSFSFEMELEGFRSPQKAVIEADFNKIYQHQAFQLGASGKYNNIIFGGEIDLAFDELRNNGAIKITNMGADSTMDRLIQTAYNKLTTMMFDPIGGTGNPVVKQLVDKIAGQKSPMDRATDLFKQSNDGSAKTPAKTSTTTKKTSMLLSFPSLDNKMLLAYNGKNLPAMTYTSWQDEISKQEEWKPKSIKETFLECVNGLEYLSQERKKIILQNVNADKWDKLAAQNGVNNAEPLRPNVYSYQTYLLSDPERIKYSDILKGKTKVTDEYNKLIKEHISELINAQDFLNSAQKQYLLSKVPPEPKWIWGYTQMMAYAVWVEKQGNTFTPEKETQVWVKDLLALGDNSTNDTIKEEIESQISNMDSKLPTPPSKTAPAAGDRISESDPKNSAASNNKDKKIDKSTNKNKAVNTGKTLDKKKDAKADFKLAVMASYQFKKIKQTGNFKINLNKYTADKVVLRFDENIGKIDCPECFLQVNLDDPLFKQREIVAMVDGYNATDFGEFINFASLKMKKTHQDGAVTYDEVRIDRDNFVKSANNFKVMYGWKGDDNRSKWLDYEYQVQWSFFGGNEVAAEWQQADANAINLTPPYLLRTIELEADPDLLVDKNVRSINVKLYYKIGGKENVKQVNMLPSREQYSAKTTILLPSDSLDYDYEISWRLIGNKTLSTGRQTTSEQILFVDEVDL